MRPLAFQLWTVLHNDVRLLWRELLASRWSLLGNLGLIATLLALAHVLSIVICVNTPRPPSLHVEAGAWMFFGFIMLGTAMTQATALLFERADFDLLFSAPTSPHAVLLARMTALVAGSALSVGLLLLPVIDGLIAGFGLRYAGSYLVWLELAGLAAAAGVGFTLTLVRWLGARRARATVQVLGAICGATVYLGIQAPGFLGAEHRPTAERLIDQLVANPLSLALARGGRGDWHTILLLGGLTLALLASTTWLLSRAFIEGAQETTSRATRKRRHEHRHRWRQSLPWVTFWKDIRLIVRDPLLLSQVLPSILYLLPALLGLYTTLGMATLAPLSVLVAGQLSAQFALVATAGEEGWDLIRMSPAPERRLRLAKMAAGIALPLALAGSLCLALAIAGRPWLALFSLGVSTLCAIGGAWLQISHVRPSPRHDVVRSRLKNSPGRLFGGMALMASGATASGFYAHDNWFAGGVSLALCLVGFAGILALVKLRALVTPD
jgi:ABC-2 type transport system permease protein